MIALKHIREILALCCLIALSASGLWAQVNTGSISGRVLDPQQAVVPKAKVLVVRTETNTERRSETNELGHYLIPLLPPGVYAISVEAVGFKVAQRTGIRLNVGDVLTVDFGLELGATTEQVTVDAAAPLVNTMSSTLGQIVENRRILDLPLNGREPFALAGLVPGVITLPPAPGTAVSIYATNPSINGAMSGTAEIIVDGTIVGVPRDRGYLGTYAPSVDSTEEFRVQTNALCAEHGRYNGGLLSVISKSGTNEFHGTLYEFHRNSALDANNFFANAAGLPLGALKRQQFGGTIGAPVLLPRIYDGKNRTFFFFNYEGLRESALNSLTFTVPTELEKRGDFSRTLSAQGQLIRMFDPNTLRLNPAGPGFVRDQFPGNVIPSNRLNPVAVRLTPLYPAPNNSNRTGNLILSVPKTNTSDIYNVRIDHQLTPAHKLLARFSLQSPLVGEPNFFGNVGNPSLPPLQQRRRSLALQDTFVVSPTLLFNFQYGLARQWGGRVAWSAGYDVTQLGLPASFRDNQEIRALPQVSVSSYTGLGGLPTILTTQTGHTLLATVTKIRGNHSWKAGYDYRAYYNNNRNNRNSHGTLNFTQGFTQGPDPNQASATAGSGFAAFLLGTVASGSLSSEPSTAQRSSYTAAFVQDDWKLTQKLTLNLGVRYEVNQPHTDRHDRITVFDPSARSPIAGKVAGFPDLRGAMLVRGPGNRRLIGADYNNLGPRFGLAYQLFRQTSLRAGYGLFYGLVATDSNLSSNYIDGLSSLTNVIASLEPHVPIASLSDPFWAGYNKPLDRSQVTPDTRLGQSTGSVVLYKINPYFQQWNMSVQQGIGQTLLIEAAYVANKGSHVNIPAGLSLNSLTAQQTALGIVNQELVPNPFAGVITDPTSSLSRPTVTRGQLIRPYPHYTGVSAESAGLGNMIYHSLQVRVEKRFSQGFTMLTSYTWSKNLNDLSTSIQDPTNLQLERSLCTSDVPHRLVLSGLWDLPIGRNRAFGADWNRALDLIAGGWQVNGIASFQSGVPLVISSIGSPRPNRVKKGAAPSGRIQDRLKQAFDTSDFAVPPSFTYGNSSRTHGDIRAHGLNHFDLSMFKVLTLREGFKAQFRLEAFNAFNRAQFAAPGSTAGTTSFGVITAQANTPRQVQVALKLLF